MKTKKPDKTETYESEQAFIEAYDIRDYDVPLSSVDVCIFTIENNELKVLLVKRADYPFKDRWALPGGFVDIKQDQDIQQTALRKLEQKTGVKTPYVEQLETIGSNTRDPRGWSMTVVYFALVASTEVTIQDNNINSSSIEIEQTRWASLKEAGRLKLAFDHMQLLKKAVERLRSKVAYSTLPVHILPKEFTLGELQQAYEIIMNKVVEKKAFRRRIDSAGLLEETGKTRQDGGRPAMLFRISKKLKNKQATYFYNRAI